MHWSGPLPLTFRARNKVLGVKTAKMGVGGKTLIFETYEQGYNNAYNDHSLCLVLYE